MSDDDLETAMGVLLCVALGALSYGLALVLVAAWGGQGAVL